MTANFLKQKVDYFANLTPSGQERFLQRVMDFMNQVDMVGREGMVVTDEIRILISASAVQLTFGLERSEIPTLQTINVFPSVFYSKLFNTNFKGLTTEGGILSISWSDFKDGYANPTDRLNLGLHELAHALQVAIEDGSFDSDFTELFREWQETGFVFFQKLKNKEITLLRSYGATNMHEFFAVVVEHFFEIPTEFKSKLPVLYSYTALLLNQDPINKGSDYLFMEHQHTEHLNPPAQSTSVGLAETGTKRETPLPDVESGMTEEGKFPRFVRKYGLNVAMGATAIGLFGGIPLMFWFYSVMLVPVGMFFLIIFICGMLGLAQWRLVKDHLDMEYHHFSMFAFSGFGMCLSTFLLFLNLVTSIKTQSVTYDYATVNLDNTTGKAYVNGSEYHPLAVNIDSYLEGRSYWFSSDTHTITIQYTTGILGFDRITGITLDSSNSL